MGRRIALAIIFFAALGIPAPLAAAVEQAPVAVLGDPIPSEASPASVFRPATIRAAFRAPRTDSAVYVGAPWFVRDFSLTLIGPGARRRTIVADATLPGRMLGVRLPLDAPLSDRIELEGSTVSAAGVPYLLTADQLASIGWRHWPYAAAFGIFLALAIVFAFASWRARSRPTAWFACAAAAQALLTVPLLGVVRPPPEVSQPLHALAQSVFFFTLMRCALALFPLLRLPRRATLALWAMVALNILCVVGGDVLQDAWNVPDLAMQGVVLLFDLAMLAVGILAVRARAGGGVPLIVAAGAATLGAVMADNSGSSLLLQSAAVSGNAVEALVLASLCATRLRTLERDVQPDGLTGIANRPALEERLQSAWKRARDARLPLAVLVVDVDRFRLFNETYGHLAGDDALRRVAAELADIALHCDGEAGRYAGDKFLLVVPAKPLAAARGIADAVRSAVAALDIAHGGAPSKRLSVTIGVASLVPDAGSDAASLVHRADAALYVAKTLGRDRVVVDEAPPVTALAR